MLDIFSDGNLLLSLYIINVHFNNIVTLCLDTYINIYIYIYMDSSVSSPAKL